MPEAGREHVGILYIGVWRSERRLDQPNDLAQAPHASMIPANRKLAAAKRGSFAQASIESLLWTRSIALDGHRRTALASSVQENKIT
jgi:hypothetical protein